MKVKINPKKLFMSGQGHTDIRKYLLVTIDDDTMIDIEEETGLDYDEIEFVLNHAGISVLISKLPDTVEIEVED